MASLQKRKTEKRRKILIGNNSDPCCEIGTCMAEAILQTRGKFFAGLKLYLCDTHAILYPVAADDCRLLTY